MLDAARSGEQVAIDRLLRDALPRIRVMVRARLSPRLADEAELEDLAQDVLVALAKGITKISSSQPAVYRSYLSRIVHNRVASWLRARERSVLRAAASLDRGSPSSASRALIEISAGIGTPSDAALQRELSSIALQELSRLAERQRDALILTLFDGLDTAELARTLDLSREAAAMLVLRAVRSLRSRVQARLGPGEGVA